MHATTGEYEWLAWIQYAINLSADLILFADFDFKHGTNSPDICQQIFGIEIYSTKQTKTTSHKLYL